MLRDVLAWLLGMAFGLRVDVYHSYAWKFDGGKFSFRQVRYVPSYTGFLVVAEGGANAVSMPVGRSTFSLDNTVPENLFKGMITAGPIPSYHGCDLYIIGHDDQGTGIFQVQPGFTCKQKKAYLVVPMDE